MSDQEREEKLTLPAPPPAPSYAPPSLDVFADIVERIGALSDALHAEDGLVHRLFAESERKAAERERKASMRHRQTMRALRKVINSQVEALSRIDQIEPRVELHEAELKIVRSRTNGKDHG